jgi:hypothetical protein
VAGNSRKVLARKDRRKRVTRSRSCLVLVAGLTCVLVQRQPLNHMHFSKWLCMQFNNSNGPRKLLQKRPTSVTVDRSSSFAVHLDSTRRVLEVAVRNRPRLAASRCLTRNSHLGKARLNQRGSRIRASIETVCRCSRSFPRRGVPR